MGIVQFMVRYWRRMIDAWRWCRRSSTILGTFAWFAATGITRGTRGRCQFVRYIIVAQPVKKHPLVEGKRRSRIQVRRVYSGDPALKEFARSSETYKSRFEQGAVAYCAFDGDLPVGFIWFVFGLYYEDEVYCAFYPNPDSEVAWDFDVYVVPEYRLTTVFLRLWDAAFMHMRRSGVKWSMSRISALNPDSVAAHRRLGAIECGVLNFFSVGRFQLAFGSSSPLVRISWGKRGMPQYRFSPPSDNI